MYQPPHRSLERALLIGDEGTRSRNLGACVRCVDRSQQDAGYTACAGCDMALRAIELRTLELGLVRLALIQQIENGSLRGVEGDDLHCLAFMDRADIHVIVVVQRAGVLGGDFRILEARLGENEGLRVDGDLQ
jgi:hypothetical protein